MISRTERQKQGISKWIKSGGSGTLVYATGVGKTRCAAMAIQLLLKSKPDARVRIIVPTTVLKNQWIDDYINPLGLSNNCVVEVINSAIMHESSCDLLVLDEVHSYASDAFYNVFECISYSMILCLTATLERLDGKEILIKKHAPVCDVITIQEAEANGWVSHFKNYLVLLDVDLTKYKELDQKFNAYFSFFNWDYSAAMSALSDWRFRNSYAKQLGVSPKDVIAASADWMRCLQQRKQFIMSHPHKAEVCKKILEARKDRKCITFSATIKEAEDLKVGYVLHSKQSKKINDEIIKKFNSDSSGVLCSSKACDVGVDIKGLSVGIIMSIDSSKIRKSQRIGRVIRFEPGKEAEMFTLVIRGTQEVKWFANSNTTDVIVIDEAQLDDVLAGKPIESRKHNLIADTKFRF